MLFLFLSFFSFYHLWYNRREVNKVISIVSLHRQCFTKQGVRYWQRSDNVNQTPQTLWAQVRLTHIRREEPSQPRWAGPSSPPCKRFVPAERRLCYFHTSQEKTCFQEPRTRPYPVLLRSPVSPDWGLNWGPIPVSPPTATAAVTLCSSHGIMSWTSSHSPTAFSKPQGDPPIT